MQKVCFPEDSRLSDKSSADGVERESAEVLIVELMGQRYGLPAAAVRELLPALAVTPLPAGPSSLEGVINIRGTIVPVLDIRKRLRLPAKPAQPSDHVVVGWAGKRLLALRVDRALELARLDKTALERTDAVLSAADSFAQIAKRADGVVPILELESMLSGTEAAALEKAMETPALPSADQHAAEERTS
jgi:purine-binding chemotaxis protein CheW